MHASLEDSQITVGGPLRAERLGGGALHDRDPGGDNAGVLVGPRGTDVPGTRMRRRARQRLAAIQPGANAQGQRHGRRCARLQRGDVAPSKGEPPLLRGDDRLFLPGDGGGGRHPRQRGRLASQQADEQQHTGNATEQTIHGGPQVGRIKR